MSLVPHFEHPSLTSHPQDPDHRPYVGPHYSFRIVSSLFFKGLYSFLWTKWKVTEGSSPWQTRRTFSSEEAFQLLLTNAKCSLRHT